MKQKILVLAALFLIFFFFKAVMVGAEEKDVAVITLNQSLQAGPDRIPAGTYTLRIKEAGDSKRILLVKDNMVISDELAIEIPLEKAAPGPLVVLEKMKSDDLFRIKIKAGSSMLMAYYKIA